MTTWKQLRTFWLFVLMLATESLCVESEHHKFLLGFLQVFFLCLALWSLRKEFEKP